MQQPEQRRSKVPRKLRQIRIPLELEADVERYRQDQMRPDWTNALLTLATIGLQAEGRRKPLRPPKQETGAS